MQVSEIESDNYEPTPEEIRDYAYLEGYETALDHIQNIISNEKNALFEIARFICEYKNMQ